MSVLKLEKSSGETKNGKFATIKKYIRREPPLRRARRIAARGLVYSAVVSTFLVVFSLIGFVYFYNYYSEVVEQRIGSGFWHTRAGLYAAPYKLRKGQKIAKEKVVEQLRRSGYVESAATDYIWNGSFAVEGASILIQTNNLYNNKTDSAIVEFSGDEIVGISSGTKPIKEYEIQPELLSGQSEAKRGINHALRYKEIPENLRNAILTAEDQRFFEHRGVDPWGILRAIYKNIAETKLKQGGSTITQQFVKNAFLTPEKTFARKFSEAFLALALENKMSKQDIFALYCNEIYLGQHGATGIHGVEQAARAYFDKELKDINLAEAATIAGMIKNPNLYAPHKNSDEARERRDWIIGKMREMNLISPEEFEIAKRAEIKVVNSKPDDRTIAPYFVDAATKTLAEDFESDVLNTNFNIRVYTTLDTQLQEIAERTVTNQLARLDEIYRDKDLNLQASLVAINPKNGHILAMVGGRDYRRSQFNRATDAERQPGSTFKPFVYAAALEKGFTPISLYSDRPAEFNFYSGTSYKPANYGDYYAMDDITMKTALAKSSNVVAVQVALETNLYRVVQQAEEFGFRNIEPYPSIALGTMEVTPLELASAYAVFANGGKGVRPTYVAKIVSGESDVLYEAAPSDEQIVSDETAYMITDMLKAVVERGTAQKAKGALGKDVAFVGKSGTAKDGWFVGYTPNLVTVAWVGFDENEEVGQTGSEIALPLWTEFMKSALGARPELGGESFAMPEGLVMITIDPETGMMADENCPQKEKTAVPEYAVPGMHCLKHKPKLDFLLAEEAESYELPEEEIVILPSRVIVEPEQTEKLKPVVTHEDFDRILKPKEETKAPKKPDNVLPKSQEKPAKEKKEVLKPLPLPQEDSSGNENKN